jgi:predicted transcriptional regulator
MDMIQDAEVLENTTRRCLYRYISRFPGVSFPDLRELLDMNDGTLRYHLHYLEKTGMIKGFDNRGSRIYYQSLRSPELDEVRSRLPPGILLTERQENLILAIKKRNGLSQKMLCMELSMNRFTFNYNVKILMRHGLVRISRSGRNTFYHYLKEGEIERLILQRAAIDLLEGKISEKAFRRIKDQLER